MSRLSTITPSSTPAKMVLLQTLLLASAATAVVILPGGDPKPYTGNPAISSSDTYFRQSAPNEFYNNSAKLIMTSHSAVSNNGKASVPTNLHPSGDSFIRGANEKAWAPGLVQKTWVDIRRIHKEIRPETLAPWRFVQLR